MPKLIFEQDEVDLYLKEKRKHVYYQDTIDEAARMAVHADGRTPTKLIEERRPSEPQQVLDYRKKIYTAKTKPAFSKVFSSLQKIRRSADWNIRYEPKDFARISEEESLENYCELNYPRYTSLTNYLFTIVLRKYLIDPNAVIMVLPGMEPVAENEYVQPVAHLFDSCDVLDFIEDDYAVLLNPRGCRYRSGRDELVGKTFFFCTRMYIARYDQVNGRGNYDLVWQYDHNLDALPVFKLKGIVTEENNGNQFYESRIAAMLPELDEAAREYSDLQAGKVNHLYPERWEYTNTECTSCKGSGQAKDKDGALLGHVCSSCEGKGYAVAGPYSKIMVKPTNIAAGETASIPTPPAGFVEKDVEIIKVMEESVTNHIYSALAAINFEFLAQAPLNQSGTAKEVDKDELNNTVHSIAEDLVSILDHLYWFIALERYSLVYPDQNTIVEMLPAVSVPERFDILSSQHTAEDLKRAKEGKFNSVIVSALEIDYASSRFNTEPEVRDLVHLRLSLDPLANVSEDDKNSRLQNKGITELTYIISSNIQEFVTRALEEDSKFAEKTYKEQFAKITAYAQTQLSEQDAAAQAARDAIAGGTGLFEEEQTGEDTDEEIINADEV